MDPSPFLAATACLCFHRIASPATPPRPRIGFGTSYKVMAPANTFSARDPRTPFSAFAIPDHISRTNAPAPQKDSRGDRDRGTNTQHKQNQLKLAHCEQITNGFSSNVLVVLVVLVVVVVVLT